MSYQGENRDTSSPIVFAGFLKPRSKREIPPISVRFFGSTGAGLMDISGLSAERANGKVSIVTPVERV